MEFANLSWNQVRSEQPGIQSGLSPPVCVNSFVHSAMDPAIRESVGKQLFPKHSCPGCSQSYHFKNKGAPESSLLLLSSPSLPQTCLFAHMISLLSRRYLPVHFLLLSSVITNHFPDHQDTSHVFPEVSWIRVYCWELLPPSMLLDLLEEFPFHLFPGPCCPSLSRQRVAGIVTPQQNTPLQLQSHANLLPLFPLHLKPDLL